MLPIAKGQDLIQQISRILLRVEHVKQVKSQLFDYITEVEQLYSSFSQTVHKQMIAFEEKIIKNSLYSMQKTSYIVNLAKIYREFFAQLDKNSKINLISLHRIKSDDVLKQEQKLRKKCELFLKQFQQYLQTENGYNSTFAIYNNKCNDLEQKIKKYRSYMDPLAFYNQILTNESISELEKQYNDCTNFETTVINQTQGLDQIRKWMSDHVKEVNQYYVILLHLYLFILENIIVCIVDPKKENFIQNKLGLRISEMDSFDNPQNFQLQKLNNLYASQSDPNSMDDNIISDYSQLFKKQFPQTEMNSDYKFFYDRCESMRNKKLKTTDEVVKIQGLLIGQLTHQLSNYQHFEKECKVIEKDIFTNNGIDSFKKRFRKYFGSNFTEVFELSLTVIDRQKKSLEKITKSIEDSIQKLGKLVKNKQQGIKYFEKRTKQILDEHLKLKEKTYSRDAVDTEELKNLKENIAQSFSQLRKLFVELEKNESQVDKLFFINLKNHFEIIFRQAIGNNRARTLQKEKNRVNILKSLNVDSQIVLILKEDSRYERLLNDCPKPNLFSTFQSLVKKREYEETKKLLQMKENRLKNMIRSKKGCCGITSEPIKNNVLSEHACKLVASEQHKGILNITSTGLIFQEKTWNPFCDDLRLMIPQTDIRTFDIKGSGEKEAVEVGTQFGNLVFESKVCNEIMESMQKNIAFKPARQPSQRGGKRNDSSSFIKNNTSTEFRLSYEKSVVNAINSEGSRPTTRNDKIQSKNKTFDTVVKDFLKKWKEAEFFNENFTRAAKNEAQKGQCRRDYKYKNGYSKFYLKQRRDHEVEGKEIVLNYEWKISFPQSPMLHSFKHSQKAYIEGISKQLRVRIITGKFSEQQLYIKNKFKKEIEDMNTELTRFIVNTFEKEADILIEPQNDDSKSIESFNVAIDDINIDELDSRFDRGESTLRNSRLEKQRSSLQFPSSIGFKTM